MSGTAIAMKSVMKINQEAVFEVMTQACALDLDVEAVGMKIVVVSVMPLPSVNHSKETKPQLVRYFNGSRMYSTYADAFYTWVRRGGLSIKSSGVES